MKQITLLLITLIFLSCGNSEKQQSKKVQEKIVRAKKNSVELVKKNRLDSITKVKDSILEIEQMKAIGDIKFFMSEKETKEKISEFIKKSERTKYSNSDSKYPFIGNYEMHYNGLKGYYKNDKLYKLKITGNYIEWEKYETKVPKELGYIKQVIELKYGEPEFSKDIPQRYLINNNEIYLIYSWQVGVKSINVVIEDVGLYYKVNVLIYLPSVIKMINKQNQQIEKNITESDKNAF